MVRPLLAAAALAAVSAPALAQSPLPRLAGRVQVVTCRQGECVWARFAAVRRLNAGPQGELRRALYYSATESEGVSPRRLRWEPAVRMGYAFCSRVRPAYAFRGANGGLVTHYLDLFDLAGYQQASEVMYMRICHGRGPVAGNVLRRLGYRPGTRNEQMEGGVPGDLARF